MTLNFTYCLVLENNKKLPVIKRNKEFLLTNQLIIEMKENNYDTSDMYRTLESGAWKYL